jgi:hypothetical protein
LRKDREAGKITDKGKTIKNGKQEVKERSRKCERKGSTQKEKERFK